LGVVGFVLLSGTEPFSGGSDEAQVRRIKTGQYIMKPEKWDCISTDAKHFIQSLLEVDPCKRLTAQQALEHPWMAEECSEEPQAMNSVMEALQQFRQGSKFRQCCMRVMAWSLSGADRAKVRHCFMSLDKNKTGTISLEELKEAMLDKVKRVDECEVLRIFEALDYNHNSEIHYSDFLAAMLDKQIDLSDDLLASTFRRFDVDGSGSLTAQNLRQVLGSHVDGLDVKTFVREASHTRGGCISPEELAAYIRGGVPGNINNPSCTCQPAGWWQGFPSVSESLMTALRSSPLAIWMPPQQELVSFFQFSGKESKAFAPFLHP